jgi:PBP1b-binding outer membrane lipoprotein LpoB
LDEVIEILKKTTSRTQKLFDESKDLASKRIENYESILKSKESTEAQKVQALLRKMLEYDHLEWLSSQLSLFYVLQIFAFKVKIMQISIENVGEQLQKSGILEKTKDIEDTKKDIDKLMILLEAQYEFIMNIAENNKRDLPYIS